MKRLFLFVLLIALILLFTGCVTVDRTWDFLHEVDDVERIEIYNLPVSNFSCIPETSEPITSMKPDDYNGFFSDIQSITFSDLIILFPMTYDPSWYLEGYVVKILYQNGDFEVICNHGFQYQEVLSGSGGANYHYSFPDDFDWNEFVEKYIE